MCRSVPQIPVYATSITTSPGPGSAAGRSSTSKVRSPLYTATCIVILPLLARSVAGLPARRSVQVPHLGRHRPLAAGRRVRQPLLAGVGQRPPAARLVVRGDPGEIRLEVVAAVLVVAEQQITGEEDRVVADPAVPEGLLHAGPDGAVQAQVLLPLLGPQPDDRPDPLHRPSRAAHSCAFPLVIRDTMSATRMIAPLRAAIHCAGTPARVST